MGHSIFQLPQPPRGDLGEHSTLARNRFVHDDIECADAVGRDEEQAVFVDLVDIAHFAATKSFQRQSARLHQHQTRISSAISGRLTSLLNNGEMTSRRNSSTCSGARPTKRLGSIAPRKSSSFTPKDL